MDDDPGVLRRYTPFKDTGLLYGAFGSQGLDRGTPGFLTLDPFSSPPQRLDGRGGWIVGTLNQRSKVFTPIFH